MDNNITDLSPALAQSPFGKLPKELRNRIYKIVLKQPRDFRITVGAINIKQPPRHHLLALTQTCSQIRNESLGIFYGAHDFYFETRAVSHYSSYLKYKSKHQSEMERRVRCSKAWADNFRRWVHAVGPLHLSYIRRLTIDLAYCEFFTPDAENDMTEYMETILPGLIAEIAGFFKGTSTRCWIKLRFNQSVPLELPLDDLDWKDAVIETNSTMAGRFIKINVPPKWAQRCWQLLEPLVEEVKRQESLCGEEIQAAKRAPSSVHE